VIESGCLLKQEMHVLLPGGEGALPELLTAAALVGQDTHLLQVIPVMQMVDENVSSRLVKFTAF